MPVTELETVNSFVSMTRTDVVNKNQGRVGCIVMALGIGGVGYGAWRLIATQRPDTQEAIASYRWMMAVFAGAIAIVFIGAVVILKSIGGSNGAVD